MMILVTGGAGFIGSHLSKALLDRGDKIVIVDNFNDYYQPSLKEDRLKNLIGGRAEIFRLDIATDIDKLRKIFSEHNFDKVVHLAAQAGVRYSLENPSSYIKSNIVGTHNLLELVKEFKIKDFIFASSSSVYSGNKKLPWSEADPVDRPVSVYAATKKANEVEAYVYHHLYGINITGLRFFTVYGPWGRPDMAYFLFTNAIVQGKPINVYNNGKMRRDFTYIDDIVSGAILAIDHCDGYQIFNLGHNSPVELEKFISILEKEIGQVALKNYLPMQRGDFLENYADINLAKTVLGWEPKTDIDLGLEKFVVWYKDYYKI
ncbi:MAG: NAD-dependent epimerase/dehydratase family protein [Patescibacteria group bacterium]|nr:NAD-dependent epimerase/dehydratase family protein [Patescibacteria group bacterium]